MLCVAREQHWGALGLRVRQGQSRLMGSFPRSQNLLRDAGIGERSRAAQEGTWARAGEGEIEDDCQPRLGCLVRSMASRRGKQEQCGLGNRVHEVSANPHRA